LGAKIYITQEEYTEKKHGRLYPEIIRVLNEVFVETISSLVELGEKEKLLSYFSRSFSQMEF